MFDKASDVERKSKTIDDTWEGSVPLIGDPHFHAGWEL